MSAWHIFNSIGFLPTCPGEPTMPSAALSLSASSSIRPMAPRSPSMPRGVAPE